MSIDRLENPLLLESDQRSPSSAHHLPLRLQQTLDSCSKFIEGGDFRKADESVYELVDYLDSISDSILLESDNEDSDNTAFHVLSQIHLFISLPSVNQGIMDRLSFELPKAVARFACVSKRCLEIAELVIDRFIETCGPRDMGAILCEALGCPSEKFSIPGYFSPLLNGLAKVFVAIPRRHFEQVKAAVPVVLNVLKATSSKSDRGDIDFEDIFNKAISIANSIQAICIKLEDKENKKLLAVFGLFVLQVMALVSVKMGDKVSSCLPIVSRLSHFLPYCGLSYLGLITGCDSNLITNTVPGDDGDDYMSCFSYVKHGASLAVIWGQMSNEVSVAAEADLASVKDELRSNQTKRWQAVCMLKHIFLYANLPWELKKHAINFLLSILEGNASHNYHDEYTDCSVYMPSLFRALQAIEMIIIYAPDAVLRKNAYEAFKKVLADVPISMRFEILVALIKNCDSSSMISIILSCVKEEMHMDYRQRGETNNKASQCTAFWSSGLLDLLEFVLKPPKGGPPPLPEYSDAVLSALNLYRFVVITESTGKTNYTGVLSKDKLQTAYNEWLLPLRTLVTGIMAVNQKDGDQLAFDTVCGVNPIELVLYRCIELVEEIFKHKV